MEQDSLPIFVDNGIPCIWNSDDWYELRSKYRICGTLIGSLPSFPKQNDLLGLPAVLLPEEAAMLVEQKICLLYTLPNIIQGPTENDKIFFKEHQTRLLEEQTEALRKRKIEQISQKIDIIIAGKRKKMLAKGLSGDLDRDVLIQEEINRLPPLTEGHSLVHLPTEYTMNTEMVEQSIDILKPSVKDGVGHVKYSIFKDLWGKGYYITDGLKFGCDFLVYPGDPVRFHAMYMVQCLSSETLPIQPKNYVALGRLAVSVNKLAVLAVLSNDGHINYQTLQWHESING